MTVANAQPVSNAIQYAVDLFRHQNELTFELLAWGALAAVALIVLAYVWFHVGKG